MLNSVTLIGNVGAAPEVRFTPKGAKVASFRMATNRKWRDEEGNIHDRTEWHTIVCWGGLADIVEDYVTRGRLLHVHGHIETRSWNDPETGIKLFRADIVCETLNLLGPRPLEHIDGAPPAQPDPEFPS